MTFSEITTLIGSVGFPIVCCGAMGYVYWKTLSEIKITIETLKQVVEHNNKVLEDILKCFNRED